MSTLLVYDIIRRRYNVQLNYNTFSFRKTRLYIDLSLKSSLIVSSVCLINYEQNRIVLHNHDRQTLKI